MLELYFKILVFKHGVILKPDELFSSTPEVT